MDDLSHLLHPVQLRRLVDNWLCEDTPNFDYGGFVVGDRDGEAVLLCKSECVLAGRPFFDAVFNQLECTVEWACKDGDELAPVFKAAHVRGKTRNILLGERTALNIVTRASGVASLARKLKRIAKEHEWHGEISGTRKTTPGFRLVEKYALLVGNASLHRYDLSSMVMLKDNHIKAVGSISQAVAAAKSVCGFALKVEVECRNLEQALEAAAAGADVVMLDNVSPEELHRAAKEVKSRFSRVIIEASGGISDDNIAGYFSPDVDVISLGKLTQGYTTADFSLKMT